MKEQHHFQVNLGGMLDILSNHLYKSPKVFLRELLQNGVDAITMRKKRQPDWDSGRITIEVKDEKQIIIHDNGTGLSKDEIHKFLAVIGQSSKTQMINGKIPQDFIGRFGIGLLSCFMVSDSIIVHTKSATEKIPYKWVGYPDGTYTLEQTEEDCSIGTTIILTAKENEHSEYFNNEKIKSLVIYYGLYLPVPIYLKGEDERLNNIPENFNKISKSSLLKFGEWFFKEEFLDAIPIHTPNLSGVAYILNYPTGQQLQKNHSIYLKNMLLTENGENLLPNWAFFLRCVLNTNTLRPTASREDFYVDEQLHTAKDEFEEEIRKYLISLSQNSPQIIEQIIKIHFRAIKSMAVWDEDLFNLFIDYIDFETSEGYLTGAALKSGCEGYWVDSVPKFKELRPLFMSQGQLLICAGYAHDLELLLRLTNKYQLNLRPLDENSMKIVLNEVSQTEKEHSKEFLNIASEVLSDWDCKAILSKFYPSDLTVLYSIDEKAKFLRQVQHAQEQSVGIYSDVLSSFLTGVETQPVAALYFNVNNPLVRRLCSLKNTEILKDTINILYTQALLAGGHHLQGGELRAMNNSLLELIENVLDLS